MTTDTTDKAAHVLQAAREIFDQRPTWVTFFREVLGVEGIVRKAFDTPEALSRFEASNAYDEIQGMLTRLRKIDDDLAIGPREPSRVVTIRMPKSLHDALKEEAHERQTSLNKLCVSKLLRRDPAGVE